MYIVHCTVFNTHYDDLHLALHENITGYLLDNITQDIQAVEYSNIALLHIALPSE